MRTTAGLALALCWLAACSTSDRESDGSAGAALCADLVERARDCEVIGEGQTACEAPVSERDVCLFGCAIAASCEELRDAFCLGDGELSDLGDTVVSDETRDCMLGCIESVGRFACADGGDEIADDLRCDGDDDCADGSDELDCGSRLFGCEGGGRVRAEYRCDGYDDCSDGSDEADCRMFVCADGSGEVPDVLRCDYRADCPDASDEDGCAPRMCD